MPCYCDTPPEDDQAEIQKRCKENMYFDAIGILTKENRNRAEELGIKVCIVPLPDENTALCNICKILTGQQMEKIDAFYPDVKWEHNTLLDWYLQHCKDDKENTG
jgi:hypothetical protein